MSVEKNKSITRRLYEDIVGKGNFELIDELVSPRVVDHNASARGWGAGAEGVRRHARYLGEVFPDFRITVDDLVAEGDRVIAFWHFQGTHRGELWGVPPTGRRVQSHTISIVRIRAGKIIEYESRPDRLSLLMQLGSLGSYGVQLSESAGAAAGGRQS